MTCVPARGAHPGQGRIRRPGFFLRRFGRWIALGLYGFPFAAGRDSSPVGRFRALARRTRFARRGKLVRAFTSVTMTLTWPFGALSMALQTRAQMREYGQGPSSLHVLVDMYWLALRHNIPPWEYGLFRFSTAERRKHMQDYVYSNDLVGFAGLNARRGADNRDVQDKARFAKICASNGFPHVAILAVFDRGKQIHSETPFVPDAPILWVKSLRLSGGAGGAKWIKDDGAYRNVKGRSTPATELGDEFREHDCLVQPFIENHPDIAHVTNGALASLRIVTGLDARGQAEFVTALIALPHGVRESSVAGIFCSIEYESGRIRRAAFPEGEEIANHPDTGAPIIGVTVPYWHESINLVLRAHAVAFSRFAFLGWDIALTKEEPLLLEANSGWGAIFHQMLDGPLGHTSFSRIVSQYV